MEETKKIKGFIGDFKAFIMRGNVIDIAVGVTMATAFGAITTALVNNVIMPFIGWIFDGSDFAQLNITLRPEVLSPTGEVVTPALVMGLGVFLSAIVNFLLIAFVIFLFLKVINRMRKKQAEEAPAPVPNQELLLAEIRDLLRDRAQAEKKEP